MKSLTSITLLVVLALAAFVSGCGMEQENLSGVAEIEATVPAPVEVARPLRSDI